jgi:DNA-binding transcriptional ArsR family regulator
MATLKNIKALSKKIKVFSDETRLSVVSMLMTRGMYVSELKNVLKIDPTLLSHHLRLLREQGLVKTKREGKSIFYQIDNKKIEIKAGSGTIKMAGATLLLDSIKVAKTPKK